MPNNLSVQQCCFQYDDDDFQLHDISLQAREGTMLGIVGPNGSGKSTLLRLMAGILQPGEGTIRVSGRDLQNYRRRELARKIAFLPQNPESSFQYKVHEVVAQGRFPYQGAFGLLSDTDEQVVNNVLHETECDELADRYFSTLSGGEKQRVLVASVLAQEPDVMLLDEPSAALDIHHKSHIADLLWSLSRRNIAVVVVTHDLNMASQFCDRLALLSDGTLACAGPPSEVMDETLIGETYGTSVRIVPHPVTEHPMVLVLGRKTRAVKNPPSESDTRPTAGGDSTAPKG